jgi:hypothetical protein
MNKFGKTNFYNAMQATVSIQSPTIRTILILSFVQLHLITVIRKTKCHPLWKEGHYPPMHKFSSIALLTPDDKKCLISKQGDWRTTKIVTFILLNETMLFNWNNASTSNQAHN